MTTIYDRYGLTGELIYENAVSKLLKGMTSVEEAMDYIMEFARGGWTLVVDENRTDGLAAALADLNYHVIPVAKGLSDEEVVRQYAKRGVFVTSDVSDFDLSMVPDPFDEGMILVPDDADAGRLAKAIEKVLMRWRKTQRQQPVKVRITKADL